MPVPPIQTNPSLLAQTQALARGSTPLSQLGRVNLSSAMISGNTLNSNRCDLQTAGTPFNHHASTHTFAPSMREVPPPFLIGSPESRQGTAFSNQRSY